MLLLLLILGCTEHPPEPPPDLTPAVDRIVATLEEAARLDREGRESEARIAWRRAHLVFEEQVEPHLREHLPAREVVLTEYLFGRSRSEIDQRQGRPRAVVSALEERLRAQASAVHPVEVVASAPHG